MCLFLQHELSANRQQTQSRGVPARRPFHAQRVPQLIPHYLVAAAKPDNVRASTLSGQDCPVQPGCPQPTEIA